LVYFRIVEACGNSGFLTGSFSMIAKEFPSNVATMFAILETFFGIGMIMGPTIGGALYELGGFTLPFVSLGGKNNYYLHSNFIQLFVKQDF
jgi:MFS family permease